MTEEIKDGMRIEYGSTIYRYRGYDVRFNENSDLWSCSALNVEHAQLSVVKDKIGKIDAEARKMDGVPVLIVLSHSLSMTPATAVLVDADKAGIWTTRLTKDRKFNRSEVAKREKHKLEDLAADTPENRAIIEECIAEQKRIYELQSQLRAKIAAIPRFVLPEVKPVEAMPEDEAQKLAARPIRTKKR